MYSYKGFTPGSTSNTSRIIKYVAEYNVLYPNENINTCYCYPNKYDKNTPGTETSSSNMSYAAKVAKTVFSNKGGKIRYGNFYLGNPLNVNHLGRIEGMPGGSGAPPVNKF